MLLLLLLFAYPIKLLPLNKSNPPVVVVRSASISKEVPSISAKTLFTNCAAAVASPFLHKRKNCAALTKSSDSTKELGSEVAILFRVNEGEIVSGHTQTSQEYRRQVRRQG